MSYSPLLSHTQFCSPGFVVCDEFNQSNKNLFSVNNSSSFRWLLIVFSSFIKVLLNVSFSNPLKSSFIHWTSLAQLLPASGFCGQLEIHSIHCCAYTCSMRLKSKGLPSLHKSFWAPRSLDKLPLRIQTSVTPIDAISKAYYEGISW